jgi:amino acid adenylation domain-containing protein
VEDDFYRLGGNSILAIRLVNRLNKELDVTVNVSVLFNCRTIRKLSGQLSSGEMVRIWAAPVSSVEDQLLSFSQERLWFIDTYEGGSSAYNIPIVLELSDDVDIDRVEQSLRAIVHRHEVLRSLIKTGKSGRGYQEVLDDIVHPLTIVRETFRDNSSLECVLSVMAGHVFKLEEEYPVHAGIYTLCTKNDVCTHYLSVVFHHIAFDGWSTDIFLRELLHYYHTGVSAENTNLLSPLSLQYKEFARWQRSYLTGEVLTRQLSYWKDQLSGYETLYLPIDKPRPAQFSYMGDNILFTIDKDTSDALRAVSRELEVSMYSLLLSGYYLLLNAYSNQRDIVVGSPVSNRHYEGIGDLIGFFVNTLALREAIDPDVLLIDFVRSVGRSVVNAQLHQDLPFEKLVEELNVEQDTSRHPIFQVMFGVQDFGGSGIAENELFQPYSGVVDYPVAKYDLTTILDDSGDELTGVFNYSTALFRGDTIASYVSTYKWLLNQLAGLKEGDIRKLQSVHYLNATQYQDMVYDWNATERVYPSDKTLHALFEEQVAVRPDHIAVVYEDRKLTYRELNHKANQLAAYLRGTYGIGADDRVGLYLDRSEYMLIAILGVLKAGGAYVPVDIVYPDDRISYILSDIGTGVVLTNEVYADKLKIVTVGMAIVPVAIDSKAFAATIETYPTTDLKRINDAESLAYVMYTSGTTGMPKGVMVTHRNVTRLVKNVDYVSFEEDDKVLGLANYAFDGSVFDIFGALLNGSTLVIADKDVFLDIKLLEQLLVEQEITISFITTSLFHTLVDEDLSVLHELKYIVAGGEQLSATHARRLLSRGGRVRLVNGYGPTESTTFATTYLCDESADVIPIGRPIANTTVYVLDGAHHPVPVGAIWGSLVVRKTMEETVGRSLMKVVVVL